MGKSSEMGLPAHPWDDIDADTLAARGSMKWTRFPGTLPGFVAEMDFPLDPAVATALHRAIDLPLLGYLPEPTKNAVREATSAFVSLRWGFEVAPERVFPTADVLSAYEAVLRTFVSPGSPVIVPTPAYMPFMTLTPRLGYPIIQVPMREDSTGRFVMDIEAIEGHLAAGAKMVVLCNPHNPLGLVYREDELRALADVVERHGGLVFADEIHAPLTLGDHRHIPYASVGEDAAAHSITAISASKAWNLPGLKCAQILVTSDTMLPGVTEAEFAISHGASTLGVLATTAAYRDGGPWLDSAREYLTGSAKWVEQFCRDHLPGSGLRTLEGTYICWLDARGVDIGSHRSPAHFFGDVARVSVTDGALCGDVGVGHIRLTIATPRPILGEILHRLALHWTQHEALPGLPQRIA